MHLSDFPRDSCRFLWLWNGALWIDSLPSVQGQSQDRHGKAVRHKSPGSQNLWHRLGIAGFAIKILFLLRSPSGPISPNGPTPFHGVLCLRKKSPVINPSRRILVRAVPVPPGYLFARFTSLNLSTLPEQANFPVAFLLTHNVSPCVTGTI